MKFSNKALFTATSTLIALGIAACGQPSEESEPLGTGQAYMPLQSGDGTALGATFNVLVGPCTGADSVTDLVDTKTTEPTEPALLFALPGAVDSDGVAAGCQGGTPYCMELVDPGWIFYEYDGSGATTNINNWDAVPAVDVELISPVRADFTMCEGMPINLTEVPHYTFDWNGNLVTPGFGTVSVDLDVNVNACSSECTSAPGVAGEERCAHINTEVVGSEPACYMQCDMDDDCAADYLCLPMSDEVAFGAGGGASANPVPGLCVGPFPPPSAE